MDLEERRSMCSKPPDPHCEAEKSKNWEEEVFRKAKKQKVKWQFVSRKLEGLRADFCQQEVRSYQWSSGTNKCSLLTGRYISWSCSLKDEKSSLIRHLHLQEAYIITQMLQVRNNCYWVVQTAKLIIIIIIYLFTIAPTGPGSHLVIRELCKKLSIYKLHSNLW